MEKNNIKNILNFNNKRIDATIISFEQIIKLVLYLNDTLEQNIDGDVVEFGCYVGESSKYLMKTLLEYNSNKKLYLYDSFEGLPPLSKWEEGSGWEPGTLKSTEEILESNFKNNNLPIPIIHKDWFKDIPVDKLPEKISFAFLDGDFYDSIYDSLNKIFDRVSDNGYIFFHDYQRFDLPGVRSAIEDVFKERGIDYTVIEICEQLGVYVKNGTFKNIDYFDENKPKIKSGGVTVVTGIWDIKRDELTVGWNRNFDHYLKNFENLLKSNDNMIIYIEEQYKSFVEERRDGENTMIIVREVDWFKNNKDIFLKIQEIRTNPDWYKQVGWLSQSTQAKLEMYNPLVMSKMFLLNDATIFDPFNSSHLVWIDGGLTNTVHEGYFWKDKVISNLEKYMNKFTFVCFPYGGKQEIHGFKYQEMCGYAEGAIDKVARGGIFGGPKDLISQINKIYHDLLLDTLSNGLMGTEESIFTIMTYKYPEFIHYYEIEENGLLGVFFENLKINSLVSKQEKMDMVKPNPHNKYNTALYVLTFNSPDQFEKLCISFEEYDKNLLDKPKKFLLNNSLNRDTDISYTELCNKYGFDEIKKDNLGICGGRQFIAEHAEENGFDYHFFFEDDMFFYLGSDEFCKNGFRRKIKNFYDIMMDIIWKENFDFLKWNFSEFFGDNTKQWAWHNVPAGVRSQLFPETPVKVTSDPNVAPFLNFKNIKSNREVPYATGEIYYCNWPQVVSREGNKKMFLTTKWGHPFEQTWMSHIYQETLKGNIIPGILLATPTEHNRFDFYKGYERKES